MRYTAYTLAVNTQSYLFLHYIKTGFTLFLSYKSHCCHFYRQNITLQTTKSYVSF
uniref:Uncharacterized protein n=1 Tax=Anguilla anguilla TaxID=7936 RepID=A0A0E9RJX5_ANGAN